MKYIDIMNLSQILDPDNVIHLIANLFGPIFTAILGFFVKRIKQEPKKTKRLKWISSCLSENKTIISSLKDYREICDYYYKGSRKNPKIILLIFLFIFYGSVSFVAIHDFFVKKETVTLSLWQPITPSLWLYMNLITLIFLQFAFKRVDVTISNLEKGKSSFYENIMKQRFYDYQLLVFLLILSLAFAIFFIGGLWEFKQSFNLKDFVWLIYFVLLNVIVLPIYVRKLANLNDRFKSTLNTYLCKKHLKDLPIVHISTKYNTYFGKVYDIFDDKMIVLKNQGEIISLEWGQIISMKCEVGNDIRKDYNKT